MEVERIPTIQERLGEWWPVLEEEFNKPYMLRLATDVEALRNTRNIYPLPKDVFRAFQMTPPQKTKVIIVGQDPYHDGINATGLI